MTERFQTPAVLAVLTLLSAWLAAGVGPVMRENDQASLVYGARVLAREGSPLNRDFYNYDKQFVTYWTMASTFGFTSESSQNGALSFERSISTTNWVAFVLYGLGIAAALAVASPCCSTAQVLVAVCALFSPVILISAVTLSSAILSAGFLGLIFSLLKVRPQNRRIGAIVLALLFLSAFLAVGARADAILLMPLLCWCAADGSRLKNVILSPRTLALLVASILAVVTGRLIFDGEPVDFTTPFFNLKLYSVHLFFGLGSGLMVVIFLLAAMAAALLAVRNCLRQTAFWLLGAIALLLPTAYYAWQCGTPRYLLTTALGGCFVSLCRHAQPMFELLRQRLGQIGFRAALAVLCISAGAPLVFGIVLSSPSRAQIVLGKSGTKYPTADGYWPMGGVVPFLGELSRQWDHPIDHNGGLWRALSQADLVSSASNGKVCALNTPMYAYLQLAADLQGLIAIPAKEDQIHQHDRVISDERTLLRGWISHGGLKYDDQGTRLIDRASSAAVIGHWKNDFRILALNFDKEISGIEALSEVNFRMAVFEAIGGREFRWCSQSCDPELLIQEGRRVGWVSSEPFSISKQDERQLQARPISTNHGIVYWLDAENLPARPPDNAQLVYSSLPGYMHRDRL